ncbi:RNA polymerase, sigma-24 subunit, ECF subfamily protein [Calothrix sp. NIES-4071]|nr:RNA polymerase, sigma-24 subunit, ECF subfamily protein [Calothrix sp. NIES-4071]BAZ59429.1 RNA polymerase, sigma-24 subunit, ECF subfamily protein [Calothrix sp. NIES-4105]
MSDERDLELIFQSQQGNKAAFGLLVSRYQPMAQRLAIRVMGNKDLAQELVQEAMLQAYLSLEKLNDPTRFKSWLYGIVLNVCVGICNKIISGEIPPSPVPQEKVEKLMDSGKLSD